MDVIVSDIVFFQTDGYHKGINLLVDCSVQNLQSVWLGKDFVWRHQMLKYSVLRLLLFKELSDWIILQ